jgi:chromosome segregation ATPase
VKKENLLQVLDYTDRTGVLQRSVNMLQDEVAGISEQLQALEQSEIDIRETQETYKEEWHHVEIQRRALANDVLHMETTHARYL